MGGHGSGLFPGTLGDLSILSSCAFEVDLSNGPVENHNPVVESERVGSALKPDSDHAFPDIVDNYASYARQFSLVGGDGQQRSLFQLEGSLNGVAGVFEWIVDSGLGVTHRRFIRHGKITGKPNQRVQED